MYWSFILNIKVTYQDSNVEIPRKLVLKFLRSFRAPNYKLISITLLQFLYILTKLLKFNSNYFSYFISKLLQNKCTVKNKIKSNQMPISYKK